MKTMKTKKSITGRNHFIWNHPEVINNLKFSVILEVCCSRYNVTPKEVRSKCRRWKLSECRKMICYFTKKNMPSVIDSRIAEALNIHRSCVLKFVNKIKEQRSIYNDMREEMDQIETIILQKFNTL